jgi:putative aminopeptidase FrvX
MRHHPDEFMILNDNKFVCRAIDNRMGGFMIAEAHVYYMKTK